MNTQNNTVLITGGATGIGLALAKGFHDTGNTGIICGRREAKLAEAKAALPGLTTHVCDVADREDRKQLVAWVTATFPTLNVLVNNAGVQREIDFTNLGEGWDQGELATNLEAPIDLVARLLPHLAKQAEAAILNVTSGLAFTPLALVPVYCATKAALHSFSLSLRHQLSNTSVRVVEVAPPIVDTELDGGARDERENAERGISADEVAREVMRGLQENKGEIVIGLANNLKTNPEKMFAIINH